jgi:hypothetical protein
VESAGFTPPEPNSNKMPTDGNPNDTGDDEEEDLEEEFEEEIEEIIEEFDEEEEFEDDAVQDFDDSNRPLNNVKVMERQASRGGPQAPQVRASVQFAGVGPIEEEDDQDQNPMGVHQQNGWMNNDFNHHAVPEKPK